MILRQMRNKIPVPAGNCSLDTSKNVLNVSKYTFPGILALTHCLWQQKPETSTGHISLPSFETEHYSDPFNKKRNVSLKTTSNWFMIAVCSVQSPLWCRSLSSRALPQRKTPKPWCLFLTQQSVDVFCVLMFVPCVFWCVQEGQNMFPSPLPKTAPPAPVKMKTVAELEAAKAAETSPFQRTMTSAGVYTAGQALIRWSMSDHSDCQFSGVIRVDVLWNIFLVDAGAV